MHNAMRLVFLQQEDEQVMGRRRYKCLDRGKERHRKQKATSGTYNESVVVNHDEQRCKSNKMADKNRKTRDGVRDTHFEISSALYVHAET